MNKEEAKLLGLTKDIITQATKCKHCKKAKGNHQSKTLACPSGKKTKIGYIHYSSTQVFDPVISKNPPKEQPFTL